MAHPRCYVLASFGRMVGLRVEGALSVCLSTNKPLYFTRLYGCHGKPNTARSRVVGARGSYGLETTTFSSWSSASCTPDLSFNRPLQRDSLSIAQNECAVCVSTDTTSNELRGTCESMRSTMTLRFGRLHSMHLAKKDNSRACVREVSYQNIPIT
jgi:hypothetical protein